MMTASTRQAVLAARSGNAEAFAELVHSETRSAYRLALSILRSPTDAEDAVQDAFLRAWHDIGRLRNADRWPAWFRRLTVRSALDLARRRRVREVIPSVFPELERQPVANTADRLDLLEAFERLTPEDRAILTLRYFADLEVPDVAAALGIPLGTAKSRLHRALGRLREHVR